MLLQDCYFQLVEIKTYNAHQLAELVASPWFQQAPVIPISTHRALSHLQNPRLQPTDVLLLIAFEAQQMLGYLGVLPDTLYNEKRKALHGGWLSCMWVNPELRGQGIAKKLLATAFEKWNHHILVTEFTTEAKALYDRSGQFVDLQKKQGLRCYLRFNLHQVLPKKNDRWKPWSGLLKVVDSLANRPQNWRLRFLQKSGNSNWVLVESMDGRLQKFIEQQQAFSFETRMAKDLQWIVEKPWLKQGKADSESVRYHFSSVTNRFENRWYVCKRAGEIVGFLFVTIRNDHLKVPYFFATDSLIDSALQFLKELMIEERLAMLTVFHPQLVGLLQQADHSFLYQRKIYRNYIVTATLAANFDSLKTVAIQDGDADAVFT